MRLLQRLFSNASVTVVLSLKGFCIEMLTDQAHLKKLLKIKVPKLLSNLKKSELSKRTQWQSIHKIKTTLDDGASFYCVLQSK